MILLIKVFIFFLYLWSITEWQLLGGIISQWHALTSTSVLHYQVQSLLCFYHLKELDCRWKEKGKARGMEEEGVMGQGNKKRTKGEAEQRARMKAKRDKKKPKTNSRINIIWLHGLKNTGSQQVTTHLNLMFQGDSPMLGWFNIFMILTSRKSCEKRDRPSNTPSDCRGSCSCCDTHLYGHFSSVNVSLDYVHLLQMTGSENKRQYCNFCVITKTPESLFVVGKLTLTHNHSLPVQEEEGKQKQLVMIYQQRSK